MTQQDLANKIGVHIRTLHKWSPAKRQQWQAIIKHPHMADYDSAFFDLYAQLVFQVAALNGKQEGDYSASCEIGSGGATLFIYIHSAHHFKCVANFRMQNAADIVAAMIELEKYT